MMCLEYITLYFCCMISFPEELDEQVHCLKDSATLSLNYVCTTFVSIATELVCEITC